MATFKPPNLKLTVIGLTGPSGAGKGAVGKCFALRNIPVIDTDQVYHSLLIPPSSCLDALTAQFGTSILTPDGSLDRAAMASLVFADNEQSKKDLAVLNQITHRFVIERTIQLLHDYEANDSPAAVIDAPLLIEAGLNRMCDAVIAVLSDRKLRLTRLLTREEDKTVEQLNERLNAQPNDEFYQTHADIVIENNGEMDALQSKIDTVLLQLGLLS